MIRFFVPGKPVPKARPRVTRSGHAYTPAITKQWESDIAAVARDSGVKPLSGALKLYCIFYMPGRGKRDKVRGDLDNYIKSLCDALNGIAWEDDIQIVEICASKRRALAYKKDVGVAVWVEKWDA